MTNKKFTLNDQQLLEEIMFHRRDVRGNNFLEKEVSDEEVNTILRAASLAPSVGFSQPWEFVIIREKNTKLSIANCFQQENKKAADTFCNEKRETYIKLKLEGIIEAPVNIAVFYTPSQKPVLGQNTIPETGEYSVVCAVQNMWLMARSMNIGMGWVSIIDPESVKQILNSPKQNKLVAYLCIGYVDEFKGVPELEKIKWEVRKPISNAIHYNTYPENKPIEHGQ